MGLESFFPDLSSLMPQLPKKGTENPKSEAMTPAPGASPDFAPMDHQHQRLSSVCNATLDSDGYAYVPFEPTFTSEPGLAFAAIGTGISPVPDFRGEFVIRNGVYVGVKVYGQRNRALPVINPVNTGLLTIAPLISGLNVIFATLSGFQPFEPAAGAQVSVIAVRPSVARVAPPYTYPSP